MSVAEQIQQSVPAGTWKSDPIHSSVAFAVRHNVIATFRGEFTDFEATLVGGEAPTLTGVVQVPSIVVADENLTGHLLSPDFFDAEHAPELRFESTSLSRDGDSLVAQAELTVKGVTKPVEVRGTISGPVTDPYGLERIGLALETTVDRTEFGLNWNAPLAGGGWAVGNDVRITAELELVLGQ